MNEEKHAGEGSLVRARCVKRTLMFLSFVLVEACYILASSSQTWSEASPLGSSGGSSVTRPHQTPHTRDPWAELQILLSQARLLVVMLHFVDLVTDFRE